MLRLECAAKKRKARGGFCIAEIDAVTPCAELLVNPVIAGDSLVRLTPELRVEFSGMDEMPR